MTSFPNFSCICVTGGRPELLVEAIACFVAQDYDGWSELVVFNTCPQQTLALPNGYDPRVRIFNCDKRPTSLGASRNLAVAMAGGDVMVVWDDDDIYLPNHLTNFKSPFADPEVNWAWQSSQFYSLDNKIVSITGGGQNVVAFTMNAWEEVNGYAALNCGEDREFVGKLTSKFKGVKINLLPEDISFNYRWGLGNYHISGQGDDAKQKVNAWMRAERDFLQRVRRGQAKRGVIELKPALRHNYVQMAKNYVQSIQKQNTPS